MSQLPNGSAASFGWGALSPRHLFCRYKEKRLEVKVGDSVRCSYKGQVHYGRVDELLYLGRMMARIVTEDGQHINLPTKDLRVLKEQA